MPNAIHSQLKLRKFFIKYSNCQSKQALKLRYRKSLIIEHLRNPKQKIEVEFHWKQEYIKT